MVQVFDMVNGKPVPSVHCQFIKPLKDLIEFYPEDHLQALAYIVYVYCPDPVMNPYMQHEESLKEEIVISDIGPLKFSVECPILQAAIQKCVKMWETPVLRNYMSCKEFMDKASTDLRNIPLTYGKNGNADTLRNMVKDSPALWKIYKEFSIELFEEQAKARGNARLAYDMLPNYRDLKKDSKDDNVLP